MRPLQPAASCRDCVSCRRHPQYLGRVQPPALMAVWTNAGGGDAPADMAYVVSNTSPKSPTKSRARAATPPPCEPSLSSCTAPTTITIFSTDTGDAHIDAWRFSLMRKRVPLTTSMLSLLTVLPITVDLGKEGGWNGAGVIVANTSNLESSEFFPPPPPLLPRFCNRPAAAMGAPSLADASSLHCHNRVLKIPHLSKSRLQFPQWWAGP